MKLFPHFISHISSFFHKHSQAVIWAELAALVFLFSGLFPAFHQKALNVLSGRPLAFFLRCLKSPGKKQYKVGDFNVTAEALNQAFRYDVDTSSKPDPSKLGRSSCSPWQPVRRRFFLLPAKGYGSHGRSGIKG